jgi:predicted nucleotide-binding protein
MVSVSTGGPGIPTQEERYQTLYMEVEAEIEGLRESGISIDNPNPFRSLWDWYGHWSSELGNYQSRRQYVAHLYDRLLVPIQQALSKHEREATSDEALLQEINRRLSQQTHSASSQSPQVPEQETPVHAREPPGSATGSRPEIEGQTMRDPQAVFVVHGRNNEARAAMFAFLHSIGLRPLEWSQAVQATGKPSPYIGEILEAAFNMAQAVLILMTPDDEGHLRDKYRQPNDPPHDRTLTGQARQNVVFEAGMAWGKYQDRTILVELGTLRPFSDISGVHILRLDNSTGRRQELAQRLQSARCPVNLSGTYWHTAGNFTVEADPPSRRSGGGKRATTLSNELSSPSGSRSAGAVVPPSATPSVPRQTRTRHTASTKGQILTDRAPLLVPDGVPCFQDQNPNWLKWDEPEQHISIRNVAREAAFNVTSVLYGCETYIIGNQPGESSRDDQAKIEHWTCWSIATLAAGETVTAIYKKGASTYRAENMHIGPYGFNAPPQPTLGELLSNKASMHAARVITTYQDAARAKFASIFDYVVNIGWQRMDILPIDVDLRDLEGRQHRQ